MNALLHSRDERTIETVDFTRRMCSEEVEDCPIESAGKVMATVFWDSQSVICIDYLEKDKTVTRHNYAELLGRFDAEL